MTVGKLRYYTPRIPVGVIGIKENAAHIKKLKPAIKRRL
jgi:hypothetical protein